MPKTPILRELKPLSGMLTILYEPTSGSATGTIFCNNQGQENDRVSVALVKSSGTLDSKSYVLYRAILHYGHNIYLQQICIDANDAIVIVSETGNSNFIFNGRLSI